MLERNAVEADAQMLEKPPVSIAFGLERMGLIAMREPILSCIILFAMVIGAVFGIYRIKIDDSLSQLFRSNSKEYRQYEEVTKRFPSTEFDVLVVVEGKTLLRRDNLEKIRDLVTDLQLVEGTRGLISLFSARQAPAPGKLPAALFPAELPEGADYDKFIENRQNQRDHPRQAAVRRRHAGADRALAGAVDRRQQRAEKDDRRNPQDHGHRSRRYRAQQGIVGRAGDAARDPQRGRARRPDLQRRRHPGGMPDRDPVLPQGIVHDRGGVSAAARHSAVARHSRLGGLSASTCSST